MRWPLVPPIAGPSQCVKVQPWIRAVTSSLSSTPALVVLEKYEFSIATFTPCLLCTAEKEPIDWQPLTLSSQNLKAEMATPH